MRSYHLPVVTDASIAVSLERGILGALDLASEGDVNPALLTGTKRHSYQMTAERHDLLSVDRYGQFLAPFFLSAEFFAYLSFCFGR
jgi:hypothetical protein